MNEEGGGGERQVPFYCPYCGDQDLRPATATGGAWECASCARAFELRFTGVVRAGSGGAAP
jgi:ribosomal protein L37AE/L43A